MSYGHEMTAYNIVKKCFALNGIIFLDGTILFVCTIEQENLLFYWAFLPALVADVGDERQSVMNTFLGVRTPRTIHN